MTIIEQARELLALAECAEGSDGAAWAAGNTLERRAPEAIAALCRALIARDEALLEICKHAEFRPHDEDDAGCLRGQLVTIAEAARRALIERDAS